MSEFLEEFQVIVTCGLFLVLVPVVGVALGLVILPLASKPLAFALVTVCSAVAVGVPIGFSWAKAVKV